MVTQVTQWKKQPNRRDPEKHTAQIKAANAARYRAVQMLISSHRAEFDRLYQEQASLVGVVPKGQRGGTTAEKLISRIEDLQAQLDRLRGEGGG